MQFLVIDDEKGVSVKSYVSTEGEEKTVELNLNYVILQSLVSQSKIVLVWKIILIRIEEIVDMWTSIMDVKNTLKRPFYSV